MMRKKVSGSGDSAVVSFYGLFKRWNDNYYVDCKYRWSGAANILLFLWCCWWLYRSVVNLCWWGKKEMFAMTSLTTWQSFFNDIQFRWSPDDLHLWLVETEWNKNFYLILFYTTTNWSVSGVPISVLPDKPLVSTAMLLAVLLVCYLLQY